MKSVTENIEQSLIENQRFIEAMESHAKSKNRNLFDLPPFSMEIENGLVRPCEPVTIHLRATAAEIPQGSLTVEADYLGANPERPEVLNVAWQPDGPGKWRAEYVLKPSRPGNWRVKWEQPQFWLTRIFGVIADNELVVTLWVGSNNPRIDTEIHAHSLPGDTWVPELFNITRDPEKFIGKLSAQAQDAWRYGDRLVPFCNGNQLLPRLADRNLFKIPAESQRQAFVQVQELWLAMGLKPLEIIGSYTPGHATPEILQGLGIKALNSLCIWQDFEDVFGDEDAWQVNHVGAPIAPYFPSAEDFRKVSSKNGLVVSSMGNADCTRVYDSICYAGVPSNSAGSLRYTRHKGTAANVQRFFATFDGWINDRRNNTEPLFVTIGIENFIGCPEWHEMNREGINHAVRRAKAGGIVFASAADIADFYNRHYGKQPEHIYFQTDFMCGMRGAFGDVRATKPVRLFDRIEFSNSRMHCVHPEGEALPIFFWDYSAPWSCPEWDYRRRDASGQPHKATTSPLECSPPHVDLRQVRVETDIAPDANGVTITLKIHCQSPFAALPLAVWSIPVDADDVQGAIIGGRGRFLPVREGANGNLDGLVIVEDVPAGDSECVVRIRGRHRAPALVNFSIGDQVTGRVVHLREGARTYLWLTQQLQDQVKLRVSSGSGQAMRAMYLDGSFVESGPDGVVELTLDETWPRETICLENAIPVELGGDCSFSIVETRPILMVPFVRDYLVSPAIPGLPGVDALAYPEPTVLKSMIARRFTKDFADIKGDLFKNVQDNSIVFFQARLQCDRDCRLNALLGYDGPFKAWIDDRELFVNPNGKNPGFLKDRVEFFAAAGEHTIMLALSANEGKAWGVMLRLLWVGASGESRPHISIISPFPHHATAPKTD